MKKRGYITLKLGGKQRTLHFSMNFWEFFTDELGIGLHEIDKVFTDTINIKTIKTLIFCGLKAHDLEKGDKVDYTIYSVGDWLSDVSQDDLVKIMTAITESKVLGNELNAGIERNPNPKTRGKK